MSANQDDYVATPAGWYHRSCVHEIEAGARVEKGGLVRRKNGSSFQIPKCAYPRRSAPPSGLGSTPVANGWIEYTSATQPSSNPFAQLYANWTVPAASTASYASNQVYFTFPGLQSSEYIIQPVLQYGASGAGGGAYWTMASWHCNDGSNCIHSPLTQVAAGDAMYGSVVASSCASGNCTWTITTKDITKGQQTVLTVTDIDGYAWATSGAVEVYNLTSCDHFPATGVFYTSIKAHDKGSVQLSPSWANTVASGTTPTCSFNVTSTTSTANLYHSPIIYPHLDGPSQVWPYFTCTWTANPSGGTPPYTYSWMGGAPTTSRTFYYSNSGSSFTMRVKVTDATGRTGSDSYSVRVYQYGPTCG